jgi:ribose-phosphate pyrophosphokinase
MVIAPDKGAIALAQHVAKESHCEYASMEKTRVDSKHVEVSASLDVDDHTVAIVDDIISTGGTVIEGARWLRARGACRIYAGCVHGLFVGNGLSRIKEVCDKVAATDTVEGAASAASVAPAIAAVIKGLKKVKSGS